MKKDAIALLFLLNACSAGDTTVPSVPDGATVPDAAALDAAVGDSATDGGTAPLEADARAEGAIPAVSLATCSAADGICSGTLDPTQLGAGILAVRSATSGKDGRHYFCYPSAPGILNGKFVLHFVGTGSDPQVDLAVTRRMCALGFVALAPMYVNDKDARGTCGADSDCFDGYRREIVVGGDFIRGVSVDTANSIEGRISSALARLAVTEPTFAAFPALRDAFAIRDLSKVVLSGHSQGSGHALYLARDHAALRVVLLAGPSDRLPAPENAPSRWITEFAARTKTSPSKLYGFISEDDAIQGFDSVRDTWNVIGMGPESCVHSMSGSGYTAACRRVVLPSAGCSALAAHAVVVAENFDAACLSARPPNRNTATWTFLFGGLGAL